MDDFLLYGAYGYTGKLIAELAVARGYRPILAGRQPKPLSQLAEQLNLPQECFDLGDAAQLGQVIKKTKLVMHCAGPFSETAAPMLDACLQHKVHYLDITGEIEVFEYIADHNEMAKAVGIMLTPGVGFDVVPSDCLAAHLKKQLPDANSLVLAFKGANQVSRGTALTMAKNIGKGGAIRKDGLIQKVPQAHEQQKIAFNKEPQWAVTIPWGDVSTAYYSTGIPNIKVFTAVNKSILRMMKTTRYLGWLLNSKPMQSWLKRRINRTVTGPTEETMTQAQTYLWGKVTNGKGEEKTARLTTPEGYRLTSLTAMAAVEKILQGQFKPGFQTPSMAFGADFIMEIEGVVRG
ncbi:MAG: saccharopine dehydrogenase family protein [Cyclobacteriaceae bacterium]